MFEIERAATPVMTVSQFNAHAKAVIENDRILSKATVTGEISGFRRYPQTGHLYFTIKDAAAALSCVMYASSAATLRFAPADGVQVQVTGGATVYGKDGRFQFIVRKMTPAGQGGLLAAYEKLKERLAAEGLFERAHKKELPAFPRRVGVITSIAGAALHDILNVTGRRCPSAEIWLYPSLVQGDDAPKNLIEAVNYFARTKCVDVLIIGRGGGSIEDLWCFNDEALARALYACPVPTISAVGHEINQTICDLVCDACEPTPSAAAKRAVPDGAELCEDLQDLAARMHRAVQKELQSRADALTAFSSRGVLRDPAAPLRVKRQMQEALCARFGQAIRHTIEKKSAQLEQLAGRMTSLNPMAVLARGYSAVFNPDGSVIRGASQLNEGQDLTLRFADGSAQAEVRKVSRENG